METTPRTSFATIVDITNLFRKLQPDEQIKAEALLPIVSDSLRVEASKVGKNLDTMIATDPAYASVVKSVTVDIVGRTLMTSTNQEPVTQTSQSALGYSQSNTFLVPGGGMFIKNSELARLRLKRQRYGTLEPYGVIESRWPYGY